MRGGRAWLALVPLCSLFAGCSGELEALIVTDAAEFCADLQLLGPDYELVSESVPEGKGMLSGLQRVVALRNGSADKPSTVLSEAFVMESWSYAGSLFKQYSDEGYDAIQLVPGFDAAVNRTGEGNGTFVESFAMRKHNVVLNLRVFWSNETESQFGGDVALLLAARVEAQDSI